MCELAVQDHPWIRVDIQNALAGGAAHHIRQSLNEHYNKSTPIPS